MKMEFLKINSERVFYKGMYKKRIVQEDIDYNFDHTAAGQTTSTMKGKTHG